MSKYLRNLEVIFHSYLFLESPLTLCLSVVSLFLLGLLSFPIHFAPPQNLMQISYFLTPRKAIKVFFIHYTFQKELIKNQLCARNSPMFFIEQKSIHLGAYFGIMHTGKAKMLSKQIYNILRNRKCTGVNVCYSCVAILNKVIGLGLVEVSLNKELIQIEKDVPG